MIAPDEQAEGIGGRKPFRAQLLTLLPQASNLGVHCRGLLLQSRVDLSDPRCFSIQRPVSSSVSGIEVLKLDQHVRVLYLASVPIEQHLPADIGRPLLNPRSLLLGDDSFV